MAPTSRNHRLQVVIAIALCGVLLASGALSPRAAAQTAQAITWTAKEKPIAQAIATLRDQPDEARARNTKALALQIRQLPPTQNKLRLAFNLAALSTEGDFGQDATHEAATLQEVATTLAAALRATPPPTKPNEIPPQYIELAQLVRYEHLQVPPDPQLTAALAKMDADDARRQDADFALKDLEGKRWTLKSLTGKVVLVNFWATWCPPCDKEIPDLQSLYDQYKDQGFVILAISDEPASKVAPFIAKREVTYPVLLDPDRKVNNLFQVDGIPKSFVYNRAGKLVTESIDMRTRQQFEQMLAQADLQ